MKTRHLVPTALALVALAGCTEGTQAKPDSSAKPADTGAAKSTSGAASAAPAPAKKDDSGW
ncbi:MAG: hypothetical protein JNL21_40830 [Myxococcales bacterium]|nr:hypothetical protein [Myxococcales bacterium]